MIGDLGQRGDDGLLVLEFGIENAQRIGFDAALRIGPEFVFDGFECGFEFGDLAAAAVVGGVADGIDFELDAGKF